MSDYLPLGPEPRMGFARAPGSKVFAPGELPAPLVYVITPGFIRALGIRMHGPRLHLGGWAAYSERVVLINASAARVLLAWRGCGRQDSYARQREGPRGWGG